MLSTAFLRSVFFEKYQETILQSIVHNDVIFLPKKMKFVEIDKTDVGFRFIQKSCFPLRNANQKITFNCDVVMILLTSFSHSPEGSD